jgi:hypothetical protein
MPGEERDILVVQASQKIVRQGCASLSCQARRCFDWLWEPCSLTEEGFCVVGERADADKANECLQGPGPGRAVRRRAILRPS